MAAKLEPMPAPAPARPREAPSAEVPALVARAQEGDVAAFEQLMAIYQPRIFRFALSFAQGRDEAGDLAQEALIKVYRSLGQFRFQSSLSTWMYSIVRNVFLDHYKSRASRERALETPIEDEVYHLAEAAQAEDRLLQKDERAALLRALRQVPVAFREVVVLFDVQGLSYDEIARALRVPVGTVKSRLNRGREALRVELFHARRSEAADETMAAAPRAAGAARPRPGRPARAADAGDAGENR
jgi:RNA polymerase sigma-70 factor (ECF subfamily)